MSDIQKKFYVLRAISGKENKVREYLEAELKNTDLGEYVSQVLIPTEKTFTVRNGKKVMKERAYLPGYVLVDNKHRKHALEPRPLEVGEHCQQNAECPV